MKKIIDNLYLGDMYSIPQDADLVIACAEEIFYRIVPKENRKDSIFWQDQSHVFYNFEDYPNATQIDVKNVKNVLQVINDALDKGKKVYIHCVYGVNRSASLVFMLLVHKGYIKSDKYEKAQEQFWQIYPDHSPNPGWKKFLQLNFPYQF